MNKKSYDGFMTKGQLSRLEGKLREVLVSYPIGPRGWKQRAVFSFGVMATAALAFIPPSSGPHLSAAQDVPRLTQAQADAMAEGYSSPVVATLGEQPPVDPVEKDPTERPRMGEALDPVEAREKSPFVEVGAMTSQPGEEKDVFLTRVAQTMDLFTRTTQHEICGVIMVSESNDAFRVRLTTNRSHIGCTMVVFSEPGFERLGPDIHSHPRAPGGVEANARDIVYRKDFSCGQRMFIFDHRFSSVDFKHGEGYLVSRGQLLYQHGDQWPVRQVAVFDPIEEPVALEVGTGLDPQVSEELAASAWNNEDREGVPSTACPAEQDSQLGAAKGNQASAQDPDLPLQNQGVSMDMGPPKVRRPGM